MECATTSMQVMECATPSMQVYKGFNGTVGVSASGGQVDVCVCARISPQYSWTSITTMNVQQPHEGEM